MQVVIVGGTSQKTDNKLKEDLSEAGIIIFHEFYKDISEFYRASDLYVFPVLTNIGGPPISYNEIGTIDLPLSILEAMACNLPVLTHPFDALKRLFSPDNGLFYCNSDDKLINTLKSINTITNCKTRQKILPYDWTKVIERLENIYHELIDSDRSILNPFPLNHIQ